MCCNHTPWSLLLARWLWSWCSVGIPRAGLSRTRCNRFPCSRFGMCRNNPDRGNGTRGPVWLVVWVVLWCKPVHRHRGTNSRPSCCREVVAHRRRCFRCMGRSTRSPLLAHYMNPMGHRLPSSLRGMCRSRTPTGPERTDTPPDRCCNCPGPVWCWWCQHYTSRAVGSRNPPPLHTPPANTTNTGRHTAGRVGMV